MRKGIRCSLALLLLFAASPALAQVVTIKTPPLATSDTTFIPVVVHHPVSNPPWAGWAGGIVKMHLLDAFPTQQAEVQAVAARARRIFKDIKAHRIKYTHFTYCYCIIQ